MTQLNVKYPATQKPPLPSGPGKVIHSYVDVTPHQGEEVHDRFIRAQSEEDRAAALADMPNATVTFHELAEGEPFFDDVEMPKDKNGYALWVNVWVMKAQDIGVIEALHGDEYDVQIRDDLVRLKLGEFKHLYEMTEDESLTLDRLAEAERRATQH